MCFNKVNADLAIKKISTFTIFGLQRAHVKMLLLKCLIMNNNKGNNRSCKGSFTYYVITKGEGGFEMIMLM